MTNHFNSEIERPYRDITNLIIDDLLKNKPETYIDDSRVLKQIMYNLAHIADELRALRRDYEIVEWVDSNQEDDEQETEDEEESESTENETCVLCGKDIDFDKDVGLFMNIGKESGCICNECIEKIKKIKKD